MEEDRSYGRDDDFSQWGLDMCLGFRAVTSAVGTHYIAMCPGDTWPQSLLVPRTGLLGPYMESIASRTIRETSSRP